jgi:glycosyltransferase involved in cell wall biosynthesis
MENKQAISMQLKLGFHYHIPAEQRNDSIYTYGFQGRFIDALARRCQQVICILHSFGPDETLSLDYSIQAENVDWVSLGPQISVPRRMLNSNYYARIIQNCSNKIDVMLIRGPSPLLPVVANACKRIPTVLLLVGDYTEGIEDSSQPGWRKSAIHFWAAWNKWQQTIVARRSLVFVNSRELYEKLQRSVTNLHETRTTTLESGDYYDRSDTCTSRPFHLLYTGRLSYSKGLKDILDALVILVQEGEELILDLVGWSERGDLIVDDFIDYARQFGLEERVRYHGFKPLGEELFAYYRQADIYVIGSRSSEGFPRTIWEAMAHSLPVVATRVGSIPYYIDGAAELVSPASPKDLAGGIRRLLHSAELRRAYIHKGIALARQNSLDQQVGEMMKRIELWMEQRHA